MYPAAHDCIQKKEHCVDKDGLRTGAVIPGALVTGAVEVSGQPLDEQEAGEDIRRKEVREEGMEGNSPAEQ